MRKDQKMNRFYPVCEPDLNGNELKYLTQCINTGWISSEGEFVKRFESGMANLSEKKFGVSVSSGSAALDIALQVLDLQPGDEVIMPAFTIIACAASILRAKALPVLVDSEPDHWNMNIHQIEEIITSKTKAIMAVHTYGLPVDMDPILALAKKYKLHVIEDAAEAHGLMYKGRPCGSFGDISIFSFYANKHITTGEGGMVLTNNKEWADKACELRNHCFQPQKRFLHNELGYSLRMSNLQAAVGVAQLEKLHQTIERKRKIASWYNQHLKPAGADIQLPLAETEYAANSYWVYGILLKSKILTNDLVMKILAENKIATRPFFWPMHCQPVFQRQHIFQNQHFPVAEYLGSQGLYLPMSLNLTEDDVAHIAKKVIVAIESAKNATTNY